MLTPTTASITNFQDSFDPKTEYRLSNARLDIMDTTTARFTARTHGPPSSTAWVRGWISNEPDGGLAEAETGEIQTGSEISLTVQLESEKIPTLACIRIESERLATKHTLHVELS